MKGMMFCAVAALLIATMPARADDAMPEPLRGCWSWTNATGGDRLPDAAYSRIRLRTCADMLIDANGYSGDGVSCRLLRVVIASHGLYVLKIKCGNAEAFLSKMMLSGDRLVVSERP